jgi:hypothetical protein
MDLTCERVREVLWPLDRPRSHVPEEEAARDHLTLCSHCRSFFLRDAEIARLLRGLGTEVSVRPSLNLRLSVARSLAKSGLAEPAGLPGPVVVEIPVSKRRSTFGGKRAEFAAAAVAVLLMGGGQILASRYGAGPDTARFSTDFVRTAAVDFDHPGLDVRQIGAFYERELGRHVEPVALYQATVTRATVCDLRGELGSMIEYDLDGTRLVHYRIPLDSSLSDSPVAGASVSVDSKSGVQVAHWADADFEHALVSRVPGDYLAWLAENRFSRPPSVTNYGSPASRSWRRFASTE